MKAKITAIGHYVPEKVLTNQELEKMVDTNDDWIVTRTGIKERHILEDGKGTSYMAIKAAEKALEMRGISADELDLIIVATVTPDMFFPSTAALVQKGLKANNCWGFDLNGACTAFVYALATGSQFIEAGTYKKVLVIGADKMSSIVDYQDRNTCVLFGDAAGAVILEPAENDEEGIQDFILHIDGTGAEYLKMEAGGSLHPATHETVEARKHYIYQDGRTVFKFAVSGMASVAAEILEKNGLTGDDISLFVAHQANLRIIDGAAKRMKLTDDKVMINIDKYGNTTAATIPLAMSEAFAAGRIKRGEWLVMAAFGAGFTWGSLLLKWSI